jgi:UDP-glucose 4-epimerase
VVWEICQQAVVSGSISMQGTGAESRDFIHAADVAAAIYLIVRHADFLGESYNVASGAEVKVSDIATLVSEMLPKKITPQWQSRQRQGDPERWIADISKISAFGFKPKYDLHEGLASVLRWAQTM